MRVNVTEDHIAQGKACDACNCPIALAVIDTLVEAGIQAEAGIKIIGNCEYVSVDRNKIAWWNSQTRETCVALTPPRAAAFIDGLDDPLGSQRAQAVPFSFDLET